MKNRIIYLIMLCVPLAWLTSCEEEELGPKLGDSNSFSAPKLSNSATSTPVELNADNAQNLFEEFSWSKANYGVNIPVDYLLELSATTDFSEVLNLANTKTTSATITVEDFNDAVLELGLPAFEESTVSLRVKTIVVGAALDTLISESISRTVTTYRLSECGDFCTVGIIGSASPGDWGTDTDMRLADASGADRSTWTIKLFLKAGEVKFRASDGWDTNWGAAAFPSGTGELNGPNIPIATAGYYEVTFNDKSGEYTFTQLAAPEFTSIGIIGSATSGGWDSDTDLTQDTGDPHLWTGSITLTDGEAKFRANDDWANNWGAETFLSGHGVAGGANIPVTAGTYTVRFNDATGEYFFFNDATAYATIGVIGDATANGWDADTDLTQNPNNPYLWSGIITLSDGEAKFRADDDWTNNWGGAGFPSGTSIKNGPNIAVSAGTYVVSFNSGTGEYRLLK
ncbi:SusF/SusE family outer membrane protein [Fulvivirgaceae bacterium BMA10]|uniref:SusF/SusE family outer membrane protein n=1 Tax=Splendidivirga corallicola TaxID=3051826 RepID=A0ABT8KS98_9BACT|nr:SusF/SusE family outer membrane protein [Fulvivirgaceae bacterium BMA10]